MTNKTRVEAYRENQKRLRRSRKEFYVTDYEHSLLREYLQHQRELTKVDVNAEKIKRELKK